MLSRGLSRAQRDPAPLLGAPRLQAFLGALWSGLALAAFAGGGVSMATGGPPKVAILGAMISVSAAGGTIAGSGAGATASLAGGKTCSVVAILVSSAGAGAGVSAGGASLCAEISGAGISGFAASGGVLSCGSSAAIFSG